MNLSDINIEPWNRSLSIRYKAIREARDNKKIVLYVYEQADTSTFRYRIYNVMKATESSSEWYADYLFSNNETEIIIELLPLCDLIVLVRVQWSFEIERIICMSKSLGKKVLFDCDDLVFDIDNLSLLMNTIGFYGKKDFMPDYNYWFSYVSRIGLVASKCEGFITTNNYLGKIYCEKFNKPFRVIRNSLNKEQLIASGISVSRCNKNKFTIGYFSGSPSHNNDFLVVAKEIESFLNLHDDAILLVVGFMDFPDFLQPYIKNKQIRFKPLVNFVELQKLMAEVRVNIVPLVDNVFTNCKSELKFFESAVVNTLTVATPIYTYKNCIVNGKTGFLCKPGEWFDVLEQIYNNDVDYIDITKNAYDYAVKEYYGEKFLQEIESSFNYFYTL